MSFLSLFHNCLPSASNIALSDNLHRRDDHEGSTDDDPQEQQQQQLQQQQQQKRQQISKVSALESSISTALNHLRLSIRAILPKRIHEPTGPLVLLFDMLLSIFISPGASSVTISKLPQFTIQNPTSKKASTSDEISPAAARCQQQGCCPNPQPTEKCPVCLGPFEHMDVVRQLSCNHIFHKECIDAWLQKKSLCPVCKIDPC